MWRLSCRSRRSVLDAKLGARLGDFTSSGRDALRPRRDAWPGDRSLTLNATSALGADRRNGSASPPPRADTHVLHPKKCGHHPSPASIARARRSENSRPLRAAISGKLARDAFGSFFIGAHAPQAQAPSVRWGSERSVDNQTHETGCMLIALPLALSACAAKSPPSSMPIISGAWPGRRRCHGRGPQVTRLKCWKTACCPIDGRRLGSAASVFA